MTHGTETYTASLTIPVGIPANASNERIEKEMSDLESILFRSTRINESRGLPRVPIEPSRCMLM
jgi:hypothetical protein